MCSDILQAGSSRPAVQVKDLGKLYNLYRKPQDRLKHSLTWRFGR